MFEFLRKNIDVPFEKDAAHKFVPLIIGMMVFLATLALAGAMVISSVVKEWDASYAPGYVVEIPIKKFESRAEIDLLETSLFQALRGVPGVDKVNVISNNFSILKRNNTGEEAPASYLVFDLTVRPGYSLESTAIENSIGGVRKVFSVVDHKELRAEKLHLSTVSIIVSVLIAGIIGLAAVATIAFVTYTGMEVHQSIIDILHTLGARKKYIAQQFQDQALILALKGGLIGLIVSACTLGGLGLIMDQIEIGFVKAGLQNSNVWLLVLLTPVLGLFLATLAARITVMSALLQRTKNC